MLDDICSFSMLFFATLRRLLLQLCMTLFSRPSRRLPLEVPKKETEAAATPSDLQVEEPEVFEPACSIMEYVDYDILLNILERLTSCQDLARAMAVCQSCEASHVALGKYLDCQNFDLKVATEAQGSVATWTGIAGSQTSLEVRPKEEQIRSCGAGIVPAGVSRMRENSLFLLFPRSILTVTPDRQILPLNNDAPGAAACPALHTSFFASPSSEGPAAGAGAGREAGGSARDAFLADFSFSSRTSGDPLAAAAAAEGGGASSSSRAMASPHMLLAPPTGPQREPQAERRGGSPFRIHMPAADADERHLGASGSGTLTGEHFAPPDALARASSRCKGKGPADEEQQQAQARAQARARQAQAEAEEAREALRQRQLETRAYSRLCRTLAQPPRSSDCIREALAASSTDHAEEGIAMTRHPRPFFPDMGAPSYCLLSDRRTRALPSSPGGVPSKDEYEWTYISPQYPMEQVELLGRLQTQTVDMMYYIWYVQNTRISSPLPSPPLLFPSSPPLSSPTLCHRPASLPATPPPPTPPICHVKAVGRPLSSFDFEPAGDGATFRLLWAAGFNYGQHRGGSSADAAGGAQRRHLAGAGQGAGGFGDTGEGLPVLSSLAGAGSATGGDGGGDGAGDGDGDEDEDEQSSWDSVVGRLQELSNNAHINGAALAIQGAPAGPAAGDGAAAVQGQGLAGLGTGQMPGGGDGGGRRIELARAGGGVMGESLLLRGSARGEEEGEQSQMASAEEGQPAGDAGASSSRGADIGGESSSPSLSDGWGGEPAPVFDGVDFSWANDRED
eukprot:jgi/Mesen1/5466/ME000273S04697